MELSKYNSIYSRNLYCINWSRNNVSWKHLWRKELRYCYSYWNYWYRIDSYIL